ncbi:helix-turn-helix transcriptional regulator [uncultured Aquimarina sp.]|uniref:helix-turn-helix transcriptional regulator n=1 Tax=uncultured Aquimarina sp. TaxID=575652 RepID=UPI00260431DD|nr:helix-turn-helix transcriptional regulator [uncultured Aquimarina sp.]
MKTNIAISFFYWLLLYFLFSNICSAQETNVIVPDSLHSMNYEELDSKYNTVKRKNPQKATIYARTFLNRAKKDKDRIKQADGYYMLAGLHKDSIRITYIDTIINLTNELKASKYPAEAYLFKARIFGAQGQYQLSMNEVIKANKYANINGNIDQQYRAKYFIALLKDNLGEYQETLKLYKSIEEYRKEKYKRDTSYKSEYLMSMFALGVSYNNNKLYDSAYQINKKGLELSLKTKDSLSYDRFLLALGDFNFFKVGYTSALDSLIKFKKLYGVNSGNKINQVNITASDYHLGLIYNKKEEIKKSIIYLKKVDSITFASKNFFPSFSGAYEILITYYKKQGNKEKQLYYINRLLAFDSVIKKDTRYLSNKINKEYDTPLLLSEKQKLITSLEASKKRSNHWMLGLVALITIAIGIAVFNYRKRNVYQQRFQGLLDQQFKDLIPEKTSGYKKPQEIGISEEVVNAILKKLQAMEDNHKFLTTNLTITSLSKQLKTNPNYLSKIVNTYKGKRFGQYINELRITYVITRLQSDPKFRKYTVKAIAQEIGFNSQDAFSKAFYKNTGIHPSYFIKELEKKEVDYYTFRSLGAYED